jgi:hypothetical protein
VSDIDDLKDAVQHGFITPLQNFRAHAQALDTNYNQCVKALQDAIGSLFHPGPGPTFSGKAADTLAELVGNYLTSEQAISDYYISNSLSTHLGQAAAACDQAIASVEPLLSALTDIPGIGAAQALMKDDDDAVEELPPGPWDVPLVLGGIAAAGGAFLWAQTQQDNQIRAIWNDIDAWKLTMRGIAGQIESKLPPTPTDPKPFMPQDQTKTLDDWKEEFPDVPDSYIQALLSMGLTEKQIRDRLSRYKQLKCIQAKCPNGVPLEFIFLLLTKGHLTEDQVVQVLQNYTNTPLSPVPMTPEQQALYNKLLPWFTQKFPDISPVFLQHLITATFTKTAPKEEQIMKFLRGHQRDTIRYIAFLYTQIADVKGASRVLRDLTNGSSMSFKGSFYQLQWAFGNKPQIAELEPTVNGKHTADAILKNGTIIVDLKNYQFNADVYTPSQMKAEGRDFAEQIKNFKKQWPNAKFKLVLNSQSCPDGKPPKEVVDGVHSVDPTIQVVAWP